jgi:hypothetical protein
MKRAEHQPETLSLTIYGGIYMKLFRVPAADTLVPTHAHTYDHITAVLQGMVRVWRDGVLVGDFMAPATVRIPAGCKHAFRTLTPSATFACIHNADHVDSDGDPAVEAEHHLELED